MPKDHTEDPVAQAVIDRNYENGLHDGRMEGREEMRIAVSEFLETVGADEDLVAQTKQAMMKVSE